MLTWWKEITNSKITYAIKAMKPGKAAEPFKVNFEMIDASGQVGGKVMKELCQRVLNGKGIPNDWKTSVVVPIFKGKGDVLNCGSYRGVKLLEHGKKIIERVLERRIWLMVDLNKMQFGFMPGKGFVLPRYSKSSYVRPTDNFFSKKMKSSTLTNMIFKVKFLQPMLCLTL